MVLRGLLTQKRDELKLFRASARLTGFAQQLSLLLRELQRSQLTPEALNGLAETGGRHRGPGLEAARPGYSPAGVFGLAEGAQVAGCGLPVGSGGGGANWKSESRKPNTEGKPKAENGKGSNGSAFAGSEFGFRVSDFRPLGGWVCGMVGAGVGFGGRTAAALRAGDLDVLPRRRADAEAVVAVELVGGAEGLRRMPGASGPSCLMPSWL